MELSFLLEQATNLKEELDSFRPLDADTEARIFQKLRLDWNYHSNHLEGGQLTYGETKGLILFGITAQGKPLKDHLEVSGHDEAIFMIEDLVRSERPLIEVYIRELHKLILKEPYRKEAITANGEKTTREIKIGVYKDAPNHVKTKTGEIFRFATPEETPSMMSDLMAWYEAKKSALDVHPIVFAAEFHYKFIRIHPFDDGNGRLARLLMNFILMQFGYPPAIIKTEDKENYFAALQQADAGILEPFMIYVADNMLRSLEIMLRGARGESVEDPDDLAKEIALLDQKLKASSEKIEKVKSEETLIEWGEKALPFIVSEFVGLNDKFDTFYVGKSYIFGIYKDDDGNNLQGLLEADMERENIVAFINKTFSKSITLLVNSKSEYSLFGLACKHDTFNRSLETATTTEPFNYILIISISFEKAKYSIIGDHSKKKISKLYHQIPTAEELNVVFAAEAKAHLEFIKSQTGV